MIYEAIQNSTYVRIYTCMYIHSSWGPAVSLPPSLPPSPPSHTQHSLHTLSIKQVAVYLPI